MSDEWPEPTAERAALTALRRLGLGNTRLRLRSTSTAAVLVHALCAAPDALSAAPPLTAEEVLERVRAAGASVDLVGAVVEDKDKDVRALLHAEGWPVRALISQLKERRPLCTRKVRTLHEAQHFCETREHMFRAMLRRVGEDDTEPLCRCFVRGMDMAMALALGDDDGDSFGVLCAYASAAAPAIEQALGTEHGKDVLIGMVRRTLERIAKEGHRVGGAPKARATEHTALCCSALELLYDLQLLSHSIFLDIACTVSTGVFHLGLAHAVADAPDAESSGSMAAIVLTALSQHCWEAADAVGRAWTRLAHASHKLEEDASLSASVQRTILKLLGPITTGLLLTVFEDRHITRLLAGCCYPAQALVPLLARRGQPVHAQLTARIAAALTNMGPEAKPTGPLQAAKPSETVVRMRVLLKRLQLPRAGRLVLLRLTNTVAVLSETLSSAQIDSIDSVQALVHACDEAGRRQELIDAATLDRETGITAIVGVAQTPVPAEPVLGPWQTTEPCVDDWAPAGGHALRELRLDPHPLLAEALLFRQEQVHALVEQLDEVHPSHAHWDSAASVGLDNLDQILEQAIEESDELALETLIPYLGRAAEHARKALGRQRWPQALTFAGHRSLRAAAKYALSDQMDEAVVAANAVLRMHDAGLRPNGYSMTPKDLAENVFLLMLRAAIRDANAREAGGQPHIPEVVVAMLGSVPQHACEILSSVWRTACAGSAKHPDLEAREQVIQFVAPISQAMVRLSFSDRQIRRLLEGIPLTPREWCDALAEMDPPEAPAVLRRVTQALGRGRLDAQPPARAPAPRPAPAARPRENASAQDRETRAQALRAQRQAREAARKQTAALAREEAMVAEVCSALAKRVVLGAVEDAAAERRAADAAQAARLQALRKVNMDAARRRAKNIAEREKRAAAAEAPAPPPKAAAPKPKAAAPAPAAEPAFTSKRQLAAESRLAAEREREREEERERTLAVEARRRKKKKPKPKAPPPEAAAEAEAPPAAPAAVPPAAPPVEAEEDDHSCVVCMEAKRDAVALSCTHLSCCAGCSKLLEECPICRAPTKFLVVLVA